MKRIYLAGPIFGKHDSECAEWRLAAIATLTNWGHIAVNPLNRDYRGIEDVEWQRIVEEDLADIDSVDAMIVMAKEPSWGTAMEIVYAKQKGKFIVAVATEPVSPWLQYHVDVIAHNLGAAIEEVAR